MKLIDLIPYLIDQESLAKFYEQQNLNTESEALLIYFKEDIDLESEIIIFELEETEDDLIFQKEGVKYIQLFSLEYAAELIEFDLDLKDKGLSNSEIATRLVEYRLNDA